MKKILLLSSLALSTGVAFAQADKSSMQLQVPAVSGGAEFRTSDDNAAQKTTGATDSLFYVGTTQYRQIFDTSIAPYIDAVLPVDSGFWAGHNTFGHRAYAEKFSFNYKTDTTLRILGFRTIFTGRTAPTSSKTVTFNIWSVAAQSAAGTKKFNSGLPNASLKSLTMSIRNIGIGAGIDTFKNVYFPAALTNVNSSFFMGYELPAYTWGTALAGDTITMRTSRGGYGIGVGSTLTSTLDTIHGNKNVYRTSGGVWNDMYWTYGLNRNLSIAPIVQLVSNNIPNSVAGLTQTNLTFYGNYPNPAVNSTTVRLSLKKGTDVTIELTDVQGRTLSMTTHKGLASGEHRIAIETASLPAGTYVYVIHTADGDAIASQMTVAK